MNSKRVYFILIACLVLTIGLCAAGVAKGDKMLASSASSLNDLKLETSVLDEQQNSLNHALQDIEKYSDLEAIAKAVVPQDKDQARTIREIVRFADETGVPITNISFPNSDLGKEQKANTAQTTSPISQATPVEGIKGVYKLEINVSNDQNSPVTYGALINFLKKLEQNRRTSQVTNVGLQPLLTNRNLLGYTMTISVYIKP